MNILYKIFIGDSWKSSVTGYVLAVCYVLLPILQAKEFTGKELFLAAIIAIIMRFINEHGKKEVVDNNPDGFKDNQS